MSDETNEKDELDEAIEFILNTKITDTIPSNSKWLIVQAIKALNRKITELERLENQRMS